ncbi:hypothetical protein ACHHYP_08885 [Achlya hypogyna]|uniref:Uncharacterized protein n=1 Tax=Achlya hypogyna TaxID=1202772 RepID=A0A1V9YNY7_ACHHY|nr:hypothetical protein ACHHYP_08885 [Achlya hypogyna]
MNAEDFHKSLVALSNDPSVASCMREAVPFSRMAKVNATQLRTFLASDACADVYTKLMAIYHQDNLPRCHMDSHGTFLQDLGSWDFAAFKAFYDGVLGRLPG